MGHRFQFSIPRSKTMKFAFSTMYDIKSMRNVEAFDYFLGRNVETFDPFLGRNLEEFDTFPWEEMYRQLRLFLWEECRCI